MATATVIDFGGFVSPSGNEMSSLVRNVPILTSIEVSPFLRRRSRLFCFNLR